MQNIYSQIVSNLIRTRNVADEDREVYEYALKIFVRGIINFLTVIFIGFGFKMLKESLIIFAAFFVLRKFTGGIHAKSYGFCLLSSAIIFVCCLFSVKILNNLNNSYIILISALAVIIICVLAPAKHPNKIMGDSEIKVYKIISIIIFIIIVLCLSFDRKTIAISFAVSEVIVSVLLVCGKIKYCER